jgi:hypothetical protein
MRPVVPLAGLYNDAPSPVLGALLSPSAQSVPAYPSSLLSPSGSAYSLLGPSMLTPGTPETAMMRTSASVGSLSMAVGVFNAHGRYGTVVPLQSLPMPLSPVDFAALPMQTRGAISTQPVRSSSLAALRASVVQERLASGGGIGSPGGGAILSGRTYVPPAMPVASSSNSTFASRDADARAVRAARAAAASATASVRSVAQASYDAHGHPSLSWPQQAFYRDTTPNLMSASPNAIAPITKRR